MLGSRYTVTGKVWLYPGPAGWHFITLPADVADEIRVRFASSHRPFASLPVRATLGATAWSTSLFRDRQAASYLLPLKAEVRRRESIESGATATVTIEVDG